MKKIDFNRPNKEQYIEKFQNNSLNKNWPPKPEHDSLITYINGYLTDSIFEEIKEIIIPQVKEMGTTIDSNSLTSKIMSTLHVNKVAIDTCPSAGEYYSKISDVVFKEVEELAPSLIGQEDTCEWLHTY